jgi:hypothetical protein
MRLPPIFVEMGGQEIADLPQDSQELDEQVAKSRSRKAIKKAVSAIITSLMSGSRVSKLPNGS